MLTPIICKVAQSGSDIYLDGWDNYNALGVYGYNHKKIKDSQNEFARSDGVHINGIKSGRFKLYVLKYKWRFNHRDSLFKSQKNFYKGI